MIKKIVVNIVVLLFLLLSMVGIAISQSVGNGDDADFTPDNSAFLEFETIFSSFLMPLRITKAQKNAISKSAHGLMVVPTDNQFAEPYGIRYNDSIDSQWRGKIFL